MFYGKDVLGDVSWEGRFGRRTFCGNGCFVVKDVLRGGHFRGGTFCGRTFYRLDVL
jgi:hypothetical protein